MNPKRPTPRYIIKMLEVKHKKRTLKATRERSDLQGSSQKTISDFSTETLQTRRDWHETSSDENQEPTTKITLVGKTII